MAEQLDLTTAIVPATRTNYKVQALYLDWAAQVIRIDLLGSDGVAAGALYTGTEAVNLMTTLNTANLSIQSLHKRILNKLVTDGKLPAGTVSGTP